MTRRHNASPEKATSVQAGAVLFGTTAGKALEGNTPLLQLGTTGTTALAGNTPLLQLGTTSSTAKAGDWFPSASNITDSGAIGEQVMRASTQYVALTAIGAASSYGSQNAEIWYGTQAQYNALSTGTRNAVGFIAYIQG